MVNNKNPNYQDLVKFLAMISMFLDHLSLFLLEDDWLRVVGRFAAPIFLFFVGYNYYHKKKLNLRFGFKLRSYRNLLFAGCLCQLVLYFFVPEFKVFNILISISIGLLILDFFSNYKISEQVQFLLLIFISPLSFLIFDYGTIGTYFIFLGYFSHYGRERYLFKLELLMGILAMLFLTINLLNFTYEQYFVSFLIFGIVGLVIRYVNFEKNIPYKIFFLSRYAIYFFVIHFSLLAIIYGVFGL